MVDVADRFIIGSMLGVVHIAPYAVAFDLVQQLIGPIMNVIFMVAFPVIVRTFEVNSDESVRDHLYALGSRLVALGVPVAVGLGALSYDISSLVFGNEFQENAATCMPWLAAATFLAAFKSYFLDVPFQLRHATKYIGYIATLVATINVVLNILLLPRYGVIASAWATFAAFAVGTLVSWIIGRNVFKLPTLGNVLLKSIAASATMVFIMLMLPPSLGVILLFVKITAGFFTYVLMAWILDIEGFRSLLLGLSHR
jgi:O-antigen/teichoic acid export membrane protein